MKAIVLKCGVQNYFRLGIQSMNDTQRYIYSDTLFSAILSTHAKMYGRDATDELCDLFTRGKVSCSSGFHALSYLNSGRKEEFLFFLPCPIIYLAASTQDRKSLKKIQFISTQVWEQGPTDTELLALPRLGPHHVISWEEFERLKLLNQRKDIASLKQLELTKEITYPKVHVRKEGQADAYFTQTCLQLNSLFNRERNLIQTHFYFLLKGEVKTPTLLAAIRMLADEGIGGERSSGAGHFAYAKELDFPLSPSPNASYHCTLSLSIPKSEKDFQYYQYYQLIVRGGGSMAAENAISKTAYRKQLRMIREGAMIPTDAPIPEGTCPEIASATQNTSRKLRYGIPFTLPFTYHG